MSTRLLTVAAAQLGPIPRDEGRGAALDRLIALMRAAAARRARLVVFPEGALTAFFPHWFMDEPAEIDAYFEKDMPNPDVQPLFNEARRLEIGFCLGYFELAREGDVVRHYNTSILVDERGGVVGQYRKIHLPGHAEHQPRQNFQNLEKRYFDVGDLGWPVWRAFGGNVGMMICNDRRWPEAYRVMGLQDVELVLLGYNTPYVSVNGLDEPPHLPMFHNLLSMQAGAYQNATWVVGVAKAGIEEGVHQIGGTCIISPLGEIVAQAATEGDELVCATLDLDLGLGQKRGSFRFDAHRRTEHYGLIVERTGAKGPKD
ncbi:MAG: N-carbamoyl-D-amino-acid hydrolase [Hyphomicrobiales bacterium]|nr:N-carbamoyl-D-amino-acid hydrolase [Hyphomicrobiales bacterium]